MLTLALETSTVGVGVALVEEGAVIAERALLSQRHQAETLHPLIVEVLAAAGRPIAGVDAVAVDLGPGRFTGLRVGVASAKALAVALGVPLAACSSTDALCLDATTVRPGALAVAVVDMRRSEVAYATSEGGPPALCDPDGCVGHLATRFDLSDATICGDGAARYRASFEPLAARWRMVHLGELLHPSPGAVGRLGERALLAGRALDPLVVEPVYLREPDARINWSTRDAAATER